MLNCFLLKILNKPTTNEYANSLVGKNKKVRLHISLKS